MRHEVYAIPQISTASATSLSHDEHQVKLYPTVASQLNHGILYSICQASRQAKAGAQFLWATTTLLGAFSSELR